MGSKQVRMEKVEWTKLDGGERSGLGASHNEWGRQSLSKVCLLEQRMKVVSLSLLSCS
jgi:hypothetical protein